MTVRHTLASLDDEQARDLLLQVARGQEEMRYRLSRMLELMLDALMGAEADEACGAAYMTRGEGRVNRRNGYRERGVDTPLGTLTVHVPKLREGYYSPEGIIGKGRRVDAAVAAAVVEMWVQGVSTRRVERVARELGVDRLGRSEVSRLAERLDAQVDEFRSRPLSGRRYCYLWLDATFVRCRGDGGASSAAAVTAIACDDDGRKRVVGFDVFDTESYAGWKSFLSSLRARGMDGVRLVVSDDHCGLRKAVAEEFQGAAWQRCMVHMMRDVLGVVPRQRRPRAAALVRLPFAMGSRAAADAAWTLAADELASTDPRAARTFTAARDECLAYMAFPKDHWLRIRTNNVQERENREIKRRTSSVGVFPSRDALQRLVGAVLMEADEEWSTDRRIWSPENTAHAWDAPDTHTPTAAELAAARAQARAAFDALDTPAQQEQE